MKRERERIQDAASNRMMDLLHCKCFQEVCYFKTPGAADEDHHKSTCSSRTITRSNQVFMD